MHTVETSTTGGRYTYTTTVTTVIYQQNMLPSLASRLTNCSLSAACFFTMKHTYSFTQNSKHIIISRFD